MRISGGAVSGGAAAAGKYAWKHKAIITDTKAPPVINTWYTACDLTGGIEVRKIKVDQSNTETDSKRVRARLTMDGVVFPVLEGIGASIPNLTTVGLASPEMGIVPDLAYWASDYRRTMGRVEDSLGAEYLDDVMRGHSIKIEFSLETAAGTDQTLTWHIRYRKMEEVI